METDVRQNYPLIINLIVLYYMYRCPPIVKLILYAKLQYNQINFTIDEHQCPPNLSVNRKVYLIHYIYYNTIYK